MREIRKLAEIFEPYEDTYVRRFEQIKKRIIDILDIKSKAATKIIKKGMESGNELADEDIASFL